MSGDILKLEERILTGIDLGESHYREFKSALEYDGKGNISPRNLKLIGKHIGQELVSFANADGGELYIGVEDNGTITGIPHSDQKITILQNSYKNYIHEDTPLNTPLVKLLEVENKKILYFQVAKSSTIVHLTSDGRCLQRFDRENRPVSAESIQSQRNELKSLEYDRTFIPNSSVRDLDVDLLQRISQEIGCGYSPEKLLQFFNIAEYGAGGLRLRRAALLLFSKDIINWHPRCEIRFLKIKGNKLKTGDYYNVEEDESVRGNIVTIMEEAWEIWRPHLAKTKLRPGGLFKESIIFPEEACREALINAVAHRDYSIEGKPIEVLMFDDRMEIKSPGELLSTITVEGLKRLEGAHQSRNVFVARVLRELGYMREMGEGIRRIYDCIRHNDLVDPDIKSNDQIFSVTLFHKSVFSQADIRWLDEFNDFPLSKNEQRIILLGKDSHLLSTKEIMDVLGMVDTEDFRALFESLSRKGIIYSAVKRGGGGKRNKPRFMIRKPEEVQSFLGELNSVIIDTGGWGIFTKEDEAKIKKHLSKDNPFNPDLYKSLRYLEYIDDERKPTGIIKGLLIAKKLKKEILLSDNIGSNFILAEVKRVGDAGFGFASTSDGIEYFLHKSQMAENEDWDLLKPGTNVMFSKGERKIPGKPIAAKRIKIV